MKIFILVGLWIIVSSFEDVLDSWIPSRICRIALGFVIILLAGGFKDIKNIKKKFS